MASGWLATIGVCSPASKGGISCSLSFPISSAGAGASDRVSELLAAKAEGNRTRVGGPQIGPSMKRLVG